MIARKKDTTKTQYVTNVNGKRIAVLVPISDYEKLMEAQDEIACIKAYDKVKRSNPEFVPASEMFKAVEHKRKHK
jgi:hypothetical protein